MAKIKLPLMSAEVRGALGGLEFRNSIHGTIVGRRSMTAYHQTQRALANRAELARAQHAYTALTGRAQTAWDAFAKHPNTGRTAYVAAYLALIPSGLTPTDDPINTPQPRLIYSVTATWLIEIANLFRLHIQAGSGATPLLSVFIYPTYLHKSTIDRRKPRLAQSAALTSLTPTIGAGSPATRLIIRCDFRDIHTAALYASFPVILDHS